MAELRDKILHRRSPVLSKRPELFDIEDGELAVNYHAYEPGIFFKDLDDEGNRKLRKVGPIHFGPTPPNSYAAAQGYPTELSHGEMWVDSSLGEGKYLLKIWNSDSSAWIEVSDIYARVDENLDQFLDGGDGDDFIHTDGIRLKINNKTALAGFSSTNGNKLIINENDDFANGVELNATKFLLTSEEIETIGNDIILKPHEGYTFTTDSVTGATSTVFEYTTHGLFDGERVYVNPTLVDGVTPSPLAAGEYFVADATINTFKLKDAGGAYADSTGNIYISYSPEILIDRDRNVVQAGNFGLKSVDDVIELSGGAGQIAEKHWDVYHNPTNGNVRVFARVGNEVNQIETSVLTIDVKSSETSVTIAAGDPVYYTGREFSTKLAKVARADASDSDKMRAIGLATTSIAPGARGTVTILGEVASLDTSGLSGALPGGASNVGRVVYVGVGGGLTLSQPDTQTNTAQQIGIFIREDGSDGAIMVNHPSSFVSLPNLPENYIWAGVSGDEAIAHYLSPTSFKRTFDAGSDTWTISLADNIEFGGYKFYSDGKSESGIYTNISTEETTAGIFTPVTVEKFSTTYRSAKYIVQISGTSSETTSPVYQVGELLIIHNDIDAFVVEYGMVSTYNDERLGQFDAYVDSGSSEVVLTFQKFPFVSENVEIKSLRTSILV
jgi:hypothetical protein